MANKFFSKIVAISLVISFFAAPVYSFAIDIYDDPLLEPSSTNTDSYDTMSSNYNGVSDINRAVKDPAAAASLTSCSKAVPAAQRAVLGLQLAKQDPTKNDTLLTIFNNVPSLIGGIKAIDKAYVKNDDDETVLSDSAKKQWRNFGSNTANIATFGISGSAQRKKAEASGDNARLIELQEQETFRTECLDSIKISIAKNLLDRGTAEMVSLIQTGNFGDPMYVTNGKDWYNQMQDRTIIDVFGSDLRSRQAGQDLSNPYALSTIKNIISSTRDTTFQERTQYTLGNILLGIQNSYGTGAGVDNIKPDARATARALKDYSNNFSNGGWEAWLALTQNPANNPIGYGLLAQEELSRRQSAEEKAAQIENSDQLLSAKVCTSYINDDGVVVNKKTLSVKPTDTLKCLSSEVVTPGSLITERMKWFVTSDIRQLELADKFNSSISQILTTSINRATQLGLDQIKTKVSSRWSTSGFSSPLAQYAASRNGFLGGGNKTKVTYKGTTYELFLDTNSSFWKDNLNLERDLNDVQVGCDIKKGLYTTQKEYVEELAYMINPDTSPLPKVIPYVAVLDMCIPGPSAIWQDLSDPLFADYIDAVSSSDPQQLGSPDLAFTKINDVMNKRAKTSGTLNTIGSLTSAISPILPPPANGIGMIVGAGLNISSAIVKNRRVEGLKPGDYAAAINAFQQYTPLALETEAYKNKDNEVNSTIKAYEDYITYIYNTYSDANNLPVAAKARPVIGNIVEKNENVNATMEAYKSEYQSSVAVLKELEDIKRETDSIYATAKARMSAKYDVKDSTGKVVQKWDDMPAACTQACVAVNQPPPKPAFDSVTMMLKGLKLQNGLWTTGKSLRDLLGDTSNIATQATNFKADAGLFNNVSAYGGGTGTGTAGGTTTGGTTTGGISTAGGTTTGGTTSSSVPKIIYFTGDQIFINKGESVNLKWELLNTNVGILKDNSTFQTIKSSTTSSDSTKVSPTRTTSYTLTAQNGSQQVSKTILISVQ